MSLYQDSHRQLQDRFDTRRLADRLDEALVHDAISPDEKTFIENRDMFFLASVDARGHANCSYRGGLPGFVRVLDEHTLVFPNYDGNVSGQFPTSRPSRGDTDPSAADLPRTCPSTVVA